MLWQRREGFCGQDRYLLSPVLDVHSLIARRGDAGDIAIRADLPARRIRLRWSLRLIAAPPGELAHFSWMLVASSPVEAIPLISPAAVIDRFPAAAVPDSAADSRAAQDWPHSATRAATATPSPAATTHRSEWLRDYRDSWGFLVLVLRQTSPE